MEKKMDTLPVEIISMIVALLNDKDLIALHATNRQLRLKTDDLFQKLFRFQVSIEVSSASLAKWTGLMKPGRLYPTIECLVISPLHTFEMPHDGWFEFGLAESMPSERELESLRRTQSRHQSEYDRSVREQRYLLRSGKLVSDVLTILKCLPNVRSISIEPPPRCKSYASMRFIELLSVYSDDYDRQVMCMNLARDEFHRLGEVAQRAGELLDTLDEYALISLDDLDWKDTYYFSISGYISSVHDWSRSNDHEKFFLKDDISDPFEQWDLDSEISVDEPDVKIRPPSVLLLADHDFRKKLYDAAIAIVTQHTRTAKGLDFISLGQHDSPASLFSLPLAHRNITDNACNVGSLQLDLSWTARWNYSEQILHDAQQHMDSFLKRFSSVSWLGIHCHHAKMGFFVIKNVIRIENLKTILLDDVSCATSDLVQWIEPGRFQNLEYLSLRHLDVWHGHTAAVTFMDAWSGFLRQLEDLSNLCFLQISNLRRLNRSPWGGMRSSYNLIEHEVVEREKGSPWDGRLCAACKISS